MQSSAAEKPEARTSAVDRRAGKYLAFYAGE